MHAPLPNPCGFGARALSRISVYFQDVALGLALVVGTLGCGGGTTKTPQDSQSAETTQEVDIGVDPDSAADVQEDAAPEIAPDVPEIATDDTSDISADVPGSDADDAVDVAPVDVAECQTATDCVLPNLPPCQAATCDAGQCKGLKIEGLCCSDSDCSDNVECTADKCALDTHTCSNITVLGCCAGKVTILKSAFENAVFEPEFKDANPGIDNGNVKWQVSTVRAHSGNSSLYFGNECGTYDNSMTADNSCTAGPDAKGVSTSLITKELSLPKDKLAQAQFWLWLDTEPPYVPGLPAGNCKNPCAIGFTCALIGGQSQCLPEKDVLQVNVLAGDKVVSAFNSTTIGKTTANQWLHVAIDLSAWQGQTVKLQWAFSTGTGLKNNFQGIYLDDIIVETLCASAGSTCSSAQKCPDDTNACTLDICTNYSNASDQGGCFYDKKLGCCSIDADCDDGNACTVDGCQSGQCTNTPDASKVGCCKASVLFFDDDSTDLSKFTPVGVNSATVGWHAAPKQGVDAKTQALYFGNDDFTGYDDPTLGKSVGPKGSLCSKPFTLTAGTQYDLVTMDVRMETEWSGQPAKNYKNPPVIGGKKFDLLSLQVYMGGEFKDIWTSDAIFGTSEGQFVSVTASLDPWQGKTVQVCLTFDAGDGQQNSSGGVWVDNFVVKAACSKKPCYFDTECANLTCGTCEAGQCGALGCGCQKIPECCTADWNCDDIDVCTDDSCGLDGFCVHTPNNTNGCGTPGG